MATHLLASPPSFPALPFPPLFPYPYPYPLLTGVWGITPENFFDITDARRRVLVHFGYKNSTLMRLVFCQLIL